MNALELNDGAQRYTVPLPVTLTIGPDGHAQIPMGASPAAETPASAVRAQGGRCVPS